MERTKRPRPAARVNSGCRFFRFLRGGHEFWVILILSFLSGSSGGGVADAAIGNDTSAREIQRLDVVAVADLVFQ